MAIMIISSDTTILILYQISNLISCIYYVIYFVNSILDEWEYVMRWDQIYKFLYNQYDPFDYSPSEQDRLKEVAKFTYTQGIFDYFNDRFLNITKCY